MAEEDLDALGGLAEKAANAVFRLTQDPRLGRTKVGKLRGARALEFSLPGGQYRAAYVILESQRCCVVFMVGPHENFYREAEKRYRILKKRGDLDPRNLYLLMQHRPTGAWYAFRVEMPGQRASGCVGPRRRDQWNKVDLATLDYDEDPKLLAWARERLGEFELPE